MVERKIDNLDAIGSSPIVLNTKNNSSIEKNNKFYRFLMTEYVGVLLYIAIAVGLGIVILFRSYKVRPRRLD